MIGAQDMASGIERTLDHYVAEVDVKRVDRVKITTRQVTGPEQIHEEREVINLTRVVLSGPSEEAVINKVIRVLKTEVGSA
jgi:hypothetical protein